MDQAEPAAPPILDPAAPVERCVAALRQAGLHRAALVTDPASGALRCSHPALAPLAASLEADAVDFDAHDAVFLEIGAESGHLLGAMLHRTVRGQGAGGVRYWSYPSLAEFLRDGLRLSRGMGQKCALAGLWWGGGKGVIARRADADHRDPVLRRAVYRDYGRFVSGLRGCYVTAEDVGTRPEDMEEIHAVTRFTTCVPEAMGGSGNPSCLTAEGVVVAMEAALAHTGRGELAGKTVAVQGLGNVAGFMLEILLARGVARIEAVDIDPARVEEIRRRFGDERLRVRAVAAPDRAVLATRCDVLAPSAVGGILDPTSIADIRAPIVCGAANNQLADPARDAPLLAERGILFVPDFLANRMGIVNCANEQYGWYPGDPAILAHLGREDPAGIFRRSLETFERAEASGRTPWDEACALADSLSRQPHPVWGERTRAIIRHLFDAGWARGDPRAG